MRIFIISNLPSKINYIHILLITHMAIIFITRTASTLVIVWSIKLTIGHLVIHPQEVKHLFLALFN
jgi:hypothetical protein